MWLLTNTITGYNLIVIKEKTKYTVGRVGADLVISDDSSISRTHAFIYITTTQINDEENELLELEDAGSKYGTFHNDGITKGVPVPKQKRFTLAEGDRIRFGVLKSIWTVSNKTPYIACVLPTELAIQLKQNMEVLGGCILSGWNDKYTHLILEEIRLSSKLLHALLDQKPIVTCDYWKNVVQAGRRGRRSLPKVESFMPPNPENLDLKYRAERRQVFDNLTFVFLHALHFKKYAPIVEKAGGRSKHLNVGIQKSFLVRKDVVVIQYIPSTESQSSQTIDTIQDCLKLSSRRIVPEFEIGLAIIHCSTEKYCNPLFNGSVDLDPTSKLTESNESQSSAPVASDLLLEGDETDVFIPETDDKSTASTHLTDKSSVFSTSRLEQTESQPGESKAIKSRDEAMSSLQVTESVQEGSKRKRVRGNVVGAANVEMESEDDDLFNFAVKKAHLEEKRNSPATRETRQTRKSIQSPLDDDASTSAAVIAKETPKSCNNPLPIGINKRLAKKTVINMSGFLEKSQVRTKNVYNIDVDGKNSTTDNVASKQGTKRARIADIDNSDDDDLFCFGGKSLSNDDTNNAKRARPQNDKDNDSDEDLFNFGYANADEQNNSKDVNAVDLTNEQVATRINTKQIIMPRPKPLPAKICIANWLDCQLSALSIKSEQCKDEVDVVKREDNNSSLEGDSKDIEAIRGGCLVTIVNTKSLLKNRDLSSSRGMTHQDYQESICHKSIKNFKKFVKNFHPHDRRVIRTVPFTVCGSLT